MSELTRLTRFATWVFDLGFEVIEDADTDETIEALDRRGAQITPVFGGVLRRSRFDATENDTPAVRFHALTAAVANLAK